MAIPNFDEGGIGGGTASGITEGLQQVMQMGLQAKQTESIEKQNTLQDMQIKKATAELDDFEKKREQDNKFVLFDSVVKSPKGSIIYDGVLKYGLENGLVDRVLDSQGNPIPDMYNTTMSKIKLHLENQETKIKFIGHTLDLSFAQHQVEKQQKIEEFQSLKKPKQEEIQAHQKFLQQSMEKANQLINANMEFQRAKALAEAKAAATARAYSEYKMPVDREKYNKQKAALSSAFPLQDSVPEWKAFTEKVIAKDGDIGKEEFLSFWNNEIKNTPIEKAAEVAKRISMGNKMMEKEAYKRIVKSADNRRTPVDRLRDWGRGNSEQYNIPTP
jgi:hypothetical protein